MAFPANNFGKQEPGTNAEIKTFCTGKQKVTFDLFAKVSVKGDDQCPLYKYLTSHADEKIGGDIKWNFTKYLVGRDGAVLARFGTRTVPESDEIIAAVEKALAAKSG